MIVKLKNAVPRKSTGAFDFYFLKNIACVSESWSVIVSQKALSEMQLVLKGHIWTPDGRGRGSSVCVCVCIVYTCDGESERHMHRERLTLEGPVAGRPRVMLGRDGDV